MRNTSFFFIIAVILFISQPVTANFKSSLKNGKAEFYKEFDEQDYQKAVEYLEKAVKLDPDNTEARYFLGNAYGKLNSKDAKTLPDINIELIKKASEQFEIVNKLTPKYTGEIYALGPHEKISSEWGSLAMAYFVNHKPDSAIWALNEGKKRGGFSEYILSITKKALDICSEDAVLMTWGDIWFFSFLYVQNIEKYRTDVSAIDMGLLNTSWYVNYLLENKLNISMPQNKATNPDNYYYLWKPTKTTINNFTWIIHPTLYNNYISHSDSLFLNILKTNNFEKDVYFTFGFDRTNQLSLRNYVTNLILIDKINWNNEKMPATDFITLAKSILKLSRNINKNKIDDLSLLDGIRIRIVNKISSCLNEGDMKNAILLIKLLDNYAPERVYPIQDEELSNYIKALGEYLYK